MSDTIKLVEGFKLVPEGEDVILKIKDFAGKPKANPTVINVTFEHKSGATLKNSYDLKKEGGLIAFSFLARAVLGNGLTDFSVSKNGPQMVGQVVSCEVTHTEYNGNTYANIKKVTKATVVNEPVDTSVPFDEDEDEL